MNLVKFLEKNRSFVILFFCLPASFIFNLLLSLKRYIYRSILTGSENHEEKVQNISRQVIANRNKLICTSRPNWLSLSTKFFNKDVCHKVDVDLFQILDLDEKNMTVRVEPMLTVGEITDFLIPKGYSLAITLELKDATLGGLAMATGMTTHSHKAGLFHENVINYEVVLSDGRIVIASKQEHYDLYQTLPWSHGSLAILVGLTLRIVKIKKYVELQYLPFHSQQEYCNKIRELSLGDNDFVEATIYSHDEAVLMVGNYTNYKTGIEINHVSKWYKPWFYKYAEKFLKKGPKTELVPLKDYLLRHNRAIFWVVESMLPIGNNPLFRLLLGWLLPPKPAFLKFTTTPGVRAYTFTKQVFQDIVLPIDELEAQIKTAEELFDTFPLLVYPCRIYDHGPCSGQIKQPPSKYLVPGKSYAMYNDLGIYGVPGYVKRNEQYDPVSTMRKMEKFTRDVGGFSFLYADIFMSELEFEDMFDLKLYKNVQEKYKADGTFPSLFEKVKPEIDVFSFANKTSFI